MEKFRSAAKKVAKKKVTKKTVRRSALSEADYRRAESLIRLADACGDNHKYLADEALRKALDILLLRD